MDRSRGAPERPALLIAVMGITGVGKSSFISIATGEELNIGDSLEPTTSKIQMHRFPYHESEVFLADTPGFDDTEKPDIVLLEEFVEFLKVISSSRLRIAGIIYLHRISDNRMQGYAQKNLALLTELCGDKFLKRVVLVTTMWDRIDEKTGEDREKKLKSKFWKEQLRNGAMAGRFEGSRKSAIKIIEMLLEQPLPDGVILDIQQESINDQKLLPKTKAGQVIISKLLDDIQKIDRHLSSLEQQYNKMSEEGDAWSNQSQVTQVQKEISELEEQRDGLRRLEERYIHSSVAPGPGGGWKPDPPFEPSEESPRNYGGPSRSQPSLTPPRITKQIDLQARDYRDQLHMYNLSHPDVRRYEHMSPNLQTSYSQTPSQYLGMESSLSMRQSGRDSQGYEFSPPELHRPGYPSYRAWPDTDRNLEPHIRDEFEENPDKDRYG